MARPLRNNLNEPSKWKQEKYSRLQRSRRRLSHIIKGQTRVTNYFPFLDEMKKLIKDNEELRKLWAQQCEIMNKESSVANATKFLDELILSTNRNSSKTEAGYRYPQDLKLFACNLFMSMGRGTYEILYKNLKPALPSISTAERCLSSYDKKVTEGQFRFEELKKHLEDRNLPKNLWISEDGTRIKAIVEYMPSNNQFVGFAVPFEKKGLPIVKSFEATTGEKCTQLLETVPVANYAYVMMAQPLKHKSAAFCLCLFGSNNKFKTENVLSRWQWMKKEAQANGTKILGFSSDGDTRPLSAMRQLVFTKDLEMPEPWSSFFCSCLKPDKFYVQDTTHI